MILQEAFDRFLLLPFSEKTLRGYARIIGYHIAFLGPHREVAAITTEDILAWRKAMVMQRQRYDGHPKRPAETGGLSRFTIYQRMVTAKSFWRFCRERGLRADSPMAAIRLKQPPKPPTSMMAAPLSSLYALAPEAEKKPRDWAMYLFLLDTGCRVSALCALTTDHLHLGQRYAWLEEKNDRYHRAIFSTTTASALQAWLEVKPCVNSRAVFLSERTKEALTPEGVRLWLRRMCKAANVPLVSPHGIRRAVGVGFGRQQVSPLLISQHLGHIDPSTTAKHYMLDDEKERREIVERLGLVSLIIKETNTKR